VIDDIGHFDVRWDRLRGRLTIVCLFTEAGIHGARVVPP
jgi:hypothetical protein